VGFEVGHGAVERLEELARRYGLPLVRRAFASALAEAGVNVQHAMRLSAHSDAKVHARYVMNTQAMRTIPAAALPSLPLGGLPEAPRIVTARDDSPYPTSATPTQRLEIFVGTSGFEPPTPTVSR
jgi:hypothetical protein